MQRERLNTTETAHLLGVRPETIRRGLCVQGHYLGLRPVKLPNGRLLWPASEVAALLDGGSHA